MDSLSASYDEATVPHDVIREHRLFNDDLAPVPTHHRSWGTYSYSALWISMTHQIPTYMAGSSLLAMGLNWWQALLAVAIGSLLILIPILFNSHVGSKYGIPYPVAVRPAFGVHGANVAAVMRAMVAVAWFGIQTWLGGSAINQLLLTFDPRWDHMGLVWGQPLGTWIAFSLFWLLNVAIIYKGMNTLKRFENWAGPSILAVFLVILIMLVNKAHGFGPIFSQPTHYRSFWPVFLAGVAAMMGMWSTLSLNMADFTRYAQKPKQQVWGQIFGLPTTMTFFALMGILITSAGEKIYGHFIWDPVQLISLLHNRFIVVMGLVSVIILSLSVNIAANVVAPANDLSNLWPRMIRFSTGALITAVLSIVLRPWTLLSSASRFMGIMLNGFGGSLGSIAGVMIADYWLIHRRQYALWELYRSNGRYRFLGGWNWRGVAATLIGFSAAWIGWIIPAFKDLINYSWFISFGLGFFTHLMLNKLWPLNSLKAGEGHGEDVSGSVVPVPAIDFDRK